MKNSRITLHKATLISLLLYLLIGSNVVCNANDLQKGEFVLTASELTNDVVELQGEVAFYHEHFVSKQEIALNSIPFETITTTHSWNNQPKKYRNYDALTYGSYYFKLKIPEELVGEKFIIRPKHFISYASQLFVNGELCAQNGTVGVSVDDPNYKPCRNMTAISFLADSSVLDIVIWSANFHHFRGGIFKPITIGLEDQMILTRERSITLDLLIIVSLLIMFFYHLIMFGVNRKEKTSLYFALVCLVFSTDLSFQGPMCFFLFFPEAHFSFYSVLQLITPYLIPASFVMFFGSMFPHHVSKRVVNLTIGIGLLFSTITVFGSISVRSLIIEPNYIYAVLLIVYVFSRIVKLLKEKVYGARLFAFSFFLFSVCAINDILNMFEFIQTQNILTYGIVTFVFLLSILYGRQTNRLYHETLILSKDLKKLNLKLEDKVLERTDKLNTSLKNLNKLNKFQEGMTHLIAHDLKSPLMQIINIESVRVKDYPSLRNSGYRMLNMIQNMLDLYRFNNKRVDLNKSFFSVYDTIDSVIEEFSFYALKKSVKIEVIQYETYELNADIQLFKRIITNFLSNALRYSPMDGLVIIKVNSNSGDELRISVSNQGLSLSTDEKNKIFSNEGSFDSESSERQRTSGLGLHLCKMAVDEHNGSIGVDSQEGQGVEFWFTIPGVRLINKENKKKLLNFDETLELSDLDKDYLKPFAQRMGTYEIFESTKIDRVLSEIEQKSPEIKSWVQAIEKACYLLDSDKLKEIISFVTK